MTCYYMLLVLDDSGAAMALKESCSASSARKMTSSPIRVAHCGAWRFDELAIPYGMLFTLKCEA